MNVAMLITGEPQVRSTQVFTIPASETYTEKGSDNFDGPNGDLTGSVWAPLTGTPTANHLWVIGNTCGVPAGRAGGIMLFTDSATYVGNHYGSLSITRISSVAQGIVLHLQGAAGAFTGYFGGADFFSGVNPLNVYVIERFVNSQIHTLAASDRVPQVGDVVTFELANGTLRLIVNGSTILTAVDPSPITGGAIGIALDDTDGSDKAGFVDNFRAGTVVVNQSQANILDMPSDALALLRVDGANGISFDKMFVWDLDRHYPGWELESGPQAKAWFPFGLRQFGIYPNLTAPQQVVLTYIAFPVASARPYNGTETVPFQAEYADGFEDYAAAMARLKEANIELDASAASVATIYQQNGRVVALWVQKR
jgi:hypothetical protein